MLLEEAQDRLKKTKISQEQLEGLNSLYILLDLEKDDFCRIVDIVGLESLLKKQKHYDRLERAERELSAKESYINAKNRLDELHREQEALKTKIESYEKTVRLL